MRAARVQLDGDRERGRGAGGTAHEADRLDRTVQYGRVAVGGNRDVLAVLHLIDLRERNRHIDALHAGASDRDGLAAALTRRPAARCGALRSARPRRALAAGSALARPARPAGRCTARSTARLTRAGLTASGTGTRRLQLPDA